MNTAVQMCSGEVKQTHIQQIQLYPYIRLSLRFCIILLPLNSLPLFCRAMFPYL